LGVELGYESLRLKGNGTESVSGLRSYLVERAILFFCNELYNGAGAYSRTAAVVGSRAVKIEPTNPVIFITFLSRFSVFGALGIYTKLAELVEITGN
jgi:hypothetical protein